MNNFLKKAVGFISTIAVALTPFGFSPVYAQANDSEIETIKFESIEEYIEYSIPRHLYARSVIIDGTFRYSEPVVLYDFANNAAIGSEIFIFEDDKLIGKTEVYSDGDGYVSKFDMYIPDDLYSAYQSGEEIAMGYLDGSLLMYSASKGYVHIEGLENYDLPQEAPQELTSITVAGEAPSDFAVPYYLHRVVLDVKHVDNSQTYNVNGECWAACLAMKLNYQMNLNLKADDVLEAGMRAGICKYDINTNMVETTQEDEIAMYKYYGYNITRSYKLLTHSEIHGIINGNKPLAFSINNTNTPDKNGHVMLITGMVMDTYSSTYVIDDPNRSDKFTMEFDGYPSDRPANFIYSYPNGDTYNNWRYSDY